MSIGAPSRLIAASSAMSGFAIAIVCGLAAENPSGRVLGVAVVSMIVCHIVGLIVGSIGENIVNEYAQKYRASNPLSGGDAGVSGSTGGNP